EASTSTLSVVMPQLTAPVFSLTALATLSPVVAVLMTVQANVPSAIVLRANGFDPPERTIDVVSGLGTIVGSLFGPVATSLSFPMTALVSGADAGDHQKRHRAVTAISVAALVVALVAGTVATLSGVLPQVLMVALAGLAMLGIFTRSLRKMSKGPVVLGPVFAFVTTASGMSLFGLGSFFWALVIGVGVSLVLERKELAASR